MDSVQAIILGLIQGLTEFLPVSSSGHLAIGKHLFGVEPDLSFDIVVHAATVLATIVVFRKEILQLLQGLFKFKYNDETKYICMILVSMIPVFVVGMFFKDYVEALFGSGLLVVGCALLVTAALLFFSEWRKKSQDAANAGDVTYKSALWMGLAQAVAVIPGLSRSGSTIATGLICGVDKGKVARFSFLMVLVPILGEAFLDLVGGDAASGTIGGFQLALGFVAAFISGLFACKVMISIVRKAELKWFALYCVIAAIACFIMNFA
ncbi:MAG: undecaprenyl-diphosphate phosphatase [Bacteroidales bacterium]|nr:undecaprenyl-diphosphate phosphatase [Bacteroidales bacterium]